MKTVSIATPDGIDYFRLASLKGRLKLEEAGIRFKGAALRPRIAAEFGLNKRDPREMFIREIKNRMDLILEKKQQEES